MDAETGGDDHQDEHELRPGSAGRHGACAPVGDADVQVRGIDLVGGSVRVRVGQRRLEIVGRAVAVAVRQLALGEVAGTVAVGVLGAGRDEDLGRTGVGIGGGGCSGGAT